MSLTVVGKPDHNGVLAELKALVEEIESGEISVETYYLIVLGDRRLTKLGSVTEPMTRGYDSGLTIEGAVCLLEREKFRLLCVSDGVSP